MLGVLSALLLAAGASALFPVMPVSILFFGESKCPFCREWIGTTLNTTLEVEEIRNIITFEYIPWGNSYYIPPGSNWSTTYSALNRYTWATTCSVDYPPPDFCMTGPIVPQHGPEEFFGNIVQSCAKVYAPDYLTQMRFNYCFEYLNNASVRSIMPCAVQSGMASEGYRIMNCANSAEGYSYLQQQALRTLRFAPTHVGVPYTIIGGCGTFAPDDLIDVICSIYLGDKPSICPPPVKEEKKPRISV